MLHVKLNVEYARVFGASNLQVGMHALMCHVADPDHMTVACGSTMCM